MHDGAAFSIFFKDCVLVIFLFLVDIKVVI